MSSTLLPLRPALFCSILLSLISALPCSTHLMLRLHESIEWNAAISCDIICCDVTQSSLMGVWMRESLSYEESLLSILLMKRGIWRGYFILLQINRMKLIVPLCLLCSSSHPPFLVLSWHIRVVRVQYRTERRIRMAAITVMTINGELFKCYQWVSTCCLHLLSSATRRLPSLLSSWRFIKGQ